MSTLIVFFSLEGNTKLIAEKISKTISADIIELNTRKKYSTEGFKKFFWGGKSAIIGEKPELINENIDFSLYETIIIGTPIWAGTFSPPIKTLLSKYKIEGKQIALFACHGGGGAKKCFKKIKEHIPDNRFISEIDFIEPKSNAVDNCEKAVKWVKDLNIND